MSRLSFFNYFVFKSDVFWLGVDEWIEDVVCLFIMLGREVLGE